MGGVGRAGETPALTRLDLSALIVKNYHSRVSNDALTKKNSIGAIANKINIIM